MDEYYDYWIEKADVFKKNKQFEQAIKCYDKILQMKSSIQKENFWHHRGNFLMELGKYEEAIECYDKDIELNKQNFDSYFNKGVILYKLKGFVESNECFDKAFEIKYASFLKLTEQSKSLQNFKKFEKAVKNIDTAKKINLLPVEFWFYKGLVLCELEEYDKSTQCYDEALTLKPDNATVLYHKARAMVLKNKIDECLELLERVCRMDPSKKQMIAIDAVFSDLCDVEQFRTIVNNDSSVHFTVT